MRQATSMECQIKFYAFVNKVLGNNLMITCWINQNRLTESLILSNMGQGTSFLRRIEDSEEATVESLKFLNTCLNGKWEIQLTILHIFEIKWSWAGILPSSMIPRTPELQTMTTLPAGVTAAASWSHRPPGARRPRAGWVPRQEQLCQWFRTGLRTWKSFRVTNWFHLCVPTSDKGQKTKIPK